MRDGLLGCVEELMVMERRLEVELALERCECREERWDPEIEIVEGATGVACSGEGPRECGYGG